MALTFDMKTNPFMPQVNAFVSSLGQYTKFVGDINEKEYKLTKEREGQSLMNAYMQTVQSTNNANELTATTNEFLRLANSKGLKDVIPQIMQGQANQGTNIAYREQTAVNQMRVDTLRNILSNEDFISADGKIIKGKELFTEIDSTTDDPNLRLKEYENAQKQMLTTKYSVQTNEVNGKLESTITANKFNPLTGEAILGRGIAYTMFKDKDGAMRMKDEQGNIEEIPLDARNQVNTLAQQQLYMQRKASEGRWEEYYIHNKKSKNPILVNYRTNQFSGTGEVNINGEIMSLDQARGLGYDVDAIGKQTPTNNYPQDTYDTINNTYFSAIGVLDEMYKNNPQEGINLIAKIRPTENTTPESYAGNLSTIFWKATTPINEVNKKLSGADTDGRNTPIEYTQLYLNDEVKNRNLGGLFPNVKIRLEQGVYFVDVGNRKNMPLQDFLAELGSTTLEGEEYKRNPKVKNFLSGYQKLKRTNIQYNLNGN